MTDTPNNCPHCGKRLRQPDAAFCTNCGAPLKGDQGQVAATVHGGSLAKIIVQIPGEESREELFHHFFLPSVLAMQKFFETREMPEPLEDILTKTRIFLSAWKSHVDHDGAPVDPAALPRNWKGPLMYFTRPDRYPKGFFGE